MALLGALVLLNVARAFQHEWEEGEPIDYRSLYIGGRLLLKQQSIYSDSVAAGEWSTRKKTEQFSSKTDFADPWVSLMIYPPNAFILPLPLSFLAWKKARLLWWGICILSVVLILYYLYKLTHSVIPILVVLAFKGTFFALLLGQPMLPVFALILVGFYYHKDKPMLSGILFGLAMLKFTLVIPFMIWLLYYRNIRVVIIAGITSFCTVFPLLWLYPGILGEYLHKAGDFYALIYSTDSRNIYPFNDSQLNMMLNYYFPAPVQIWKIINGLMQILLYPAILIFGKVKKLHPNTVLTGLMLVSFMFNYHLLYNALLFVLVISLHSEFKYGIYTGLILFTLLSLPINALAGDWLILKFHYPLLLSLALLLFIFACTRKKIDRAEIYTAH